MGFTSMFDRTGEQITELQGKSAKIIQTKIQKKSKKIQQ